MSLISDLRMASARDSLRLHTPGHKGALEPLDLTELVDRSFPSDSVETAEKNIAEFYGAKHGSILPCGSSQGVKAAIFFSAASGIVGANSHRSVFDGYKLSGKKYVAVGERDAVTPITVGEIETALTADVGAVVVTSPTYYGFCADLGAIREFCDRKGLILIVDSAHGAHFGASARLPENAIRYADVCNLSAHKTLSALTQTAIILDNLDEARAENLREAVRIMGTTSPSYLLLSSVEHAVNELKHASERYEKLFEPIAALKTEFPFLSNDDFTRPVLDCRALGVSSEALCAALCRRGVFAEMSDGRYIVFIFTAADTPEHVERLRQALKSSVRELGK